MLLIDNGCFEELSFFLSVNMGYIFFQLIYIIPYLTGLIALFIRMCLCMHVCMCEKVCMCVGTNVSMYECRQASTYM